MGGDALRGYHEHGLEALHGLGVSKEADCESFGVVALVLPSFGRAVSVRVGGLEALGECHLHATPWLRLSERELVVEPGSLPCCVAVVWEQAGT